MTVLFLRRETIHSHGHEERDDQMRDVTDFNQALTCDVPCDVRVIFWSTKSQNQHDWHIVANREAFFGFLYKSRLNNQAKLTVLGLQSLESINKKGGVRLATPISQTQLLLADLLDKEMRLLQTLVWFDKISVFLWTNRPFDHNGRFSQLRFPERKL
jgi:hypothetical protein